MISCCTHGYASNKYYDDKNEKVPENTGKTVKEAIDEFTFEGKRILSVDLVPWPLNKPCAFWSVTDRISLHKLLNID